MKEDAQLICPIGYDDKSNVWPTIQKFVCDRLPLKDVVWRSPISSSFTNIEKLPIRFLPSSAKLFNETQHPYRRFLAPYVHIYLLCVESMDAYKTNKPFIKKWLEPYNNPKIGKQPWLIVYVPLGTSTMDVYQKVYARLSADFYTEKSGDHSVMLILPPDTGSKRTLSIAERFAQQGLYQQSYASIADLLGKLRDGVVTSFQIRTMQYDADIRKLDAARGLPNFDFWALFLVKESLALMYQMLQLPDRALSLYEELEMLLVFAPAHSLPASDWPVVIPSSSTNSSGNAGSSASGSCTPVKSNSRNGEPGQDSEALPTSSAAHVTASKPKRDLMTDACRSGEDIMVYSINTARMNILWNKFSLFQLQHYIFARQMYFLLVHLRQPTRCAEKALQYMKSSYVALEGRIQRQYPVRDAVHALTEADLVDNNSQGTSESKMLQLRKAQADVWAVCASIKLIRECRALLQLLVGGDAKYNSVFNNNSSASYNNAHSVSASSTTESFSDNLAAISSASSHGSSVVYNSLAELNRSQHGISSQRKHTNSTTTGGTIDASIHTPYTTPAMAIREILFAPELDIAVELRDSSRVLGDLIEFALKRLQALSSSTVKNASKKALDLALSTVPFDYTLICKNANIAIANSKLGAKRTVTKVGSGGGSNASASNNAPSAVGVVDAQSDNDDSADLTAQTTDKPAPSNHIISTNTEFTAVSPRNIDLVVTIEQELSLLDESRESQGVADVGDRMDQILQSIAQKVRSTSHFWSKLYELSTPSHLLYGDTSTTQDVSANVNISHTTAAPLGQGQESGVGTPNPELNSLPTTPPKRTHMPPFAEDSPGGSPMRLRPVGPVGSESSDFSPDNSPFGSRAGTPIGTPVVSNKRMNGVYSESSAVGGIADSNRFVSESVPFGANANSTILPSAAPSSSTTLRKLISRHSSRSLVMSRSQLERGKLLELCLAVLGCSAQWHLQLLANRPRFALSAMLRCADLLMCNNQLTVAAKRLEEALQCGLLAPVAAYICGTHSHSTGNISGTGDSSGGAGGEEALGDSAGIAEPLDRSVNISDTVQPLALKHKSIFQQCLAEEQLHQQQYTQHLHTILSMSIHHSAHYPLYGAWTPLWHYTLRKLLYCLQQNRNYAQYRVVLANLLTPTSADGVNRLPMQPSTLLADLLKEFIGLSNIPSLEGTVTTDGSISNTNSDASTALTANENKHGIPQPLPPLHLPFSNYFDIQIGMVELNSTSDTTSINTVNTSNTTLPPTQVSGYEVIREEWLQTTAVQLEGGFVGGYSVPIKLTCHMPGPLPVDAFYMVYKRFTADTIIHEMLNQDEAVFNGTSSDGSATMKEGEYICKPEDVNCSTTGEASVVSSKMTILPGTSTIHMLFTPPLLGDYRLDRIVIVVGTAVFERTFLPSITAATLHTYSYVTTDTLEESEHYHYDSSRVYSAGESAALAILKEYFKQHSIVQVIAPADLLNLQSVVAPVVPLDQVDDAYFSLQTLPGEVVTDLTFRAWGREFDAQKSHHLSRGFDESRSVSTNTSLRSQDMSPLMHAHKSNSRTAFNQSNSGSYNLSNNAANNAPNPNTTYSGFVSAKDATPAARRVRRAPPIDTDEYEAVQQANAAVASLLAQQGRAKDIYRSNDSGEHSVVLLSVKPGDEWTVVVQNKEKDIASATHTILQTNSTDASTRDAATTVSSFSAGTIAGHNMLHLRIPFVASLQAGLHLNSAPDSVVLVLELSGSLMRGGCTIPISVTKEAVLRISELVDMRVEVYPLYPTVVDNVYNMLLQCHLSNTTDVPIELIGYGLSTLGVEQQQQQSGYSLLDGPTSLTAISHPISSPIELCINTDIVVVLTAGESYPAGILLEVHTSNTDDAVSGSSEGTGLQFCYQRNLKLLLSQVHQAVYKHRIFTVQRALRQGNSDTSSDSAATASTNIVNSGIVVPPYVGNGVTLSLYTKPGAHPTTTAITSTTSTGMVIVKLGKVFRCQYTLVVRCPAQGQVQHSDSGDTTHYTNVSSTGTLSVNTATPASSIAQLTSVTSISAALCETSDWMVAGSTCRVLTNHRVYKSAAVDKSEEAVAPVAPVVPITTVPPVEIMEVNAVVKRLVKRIESRSSNSAEPQVDLPTTSSSEVNVESVPDVLPVDRHSSGVLSRVAEVKWIEVSYELCWDMLPVALGAAPLPPLKVDYMLGNDSVTRSTTVYPDKMSAEDRILVVPAQSDATASGNRRNMEECRTFNRNFSCAMVQIK